MDAVLVYKMFISECGHNITEVYSVIFELLHLQQNKLAKFTYHKQSSTESWVDECFQTLQAYCRCAASTNLAGKPGNTKSWISSVFETFQACFKYAIASTTPSSQVMLVW
ncbi:hypothetical protein AVEN_112555-1 [Araneus ventricosus]|uniref:Uncharacterized protein n=1 Tax=Araneus ventricosus TaxID=182803 RepID=A0A4Y2K328_ARAVE|nr:hypothetical protein AVEN_112555-1 [Araneus ventricosus]